MQLSSKDLNELAELEESLWRANTRFDREYMNRILSPEFFEFGRSGLIYTREECIDMPYQNIKAHLPLKNFEARSINKNVILVTYVSEVWYEELETSYRSSLWSKKPNGWQLEFHQGTITV
jgi:hypothetical protein